MAEPRCPGKDSQYWHPDDIFDVACPGCGEDVEFFKDDARRTCPGCGHRIANPKLDTGCAEWCGHGGDCQSSDPGSSD